jgi:O-antigen biosynthesis protein WbqP
MRQLFAFFIFIILSPFFFLVSIIIYVSDGSPIFFTQKRVGKNNVHFNLYKFRTMRKDTPDIATHLMKNPKQYLIKFGSFLRKYSLDEIPQIINIINRDMSYVGPRPALYNQNDLISLRTSKNIQSIMPGITGWAQINGRDELSIKKKVEYDLFYLQNKNLFLDLKIILLTFTKVFFKKGVSH